jgi:hypothetical protein
MPNTSAMPNGQPSLMRHESKARLPRRQTLSKIQWSAVIIVAIIVALGAAITQAYLATDGSYDLRTSDRSPSHLSEFHSAQASSILNGHLNVPRDVLLGECFDFQQRCYGYFGPTPALVRMPVALVSSQAATWDALYLVASLSLSVVIALLIGMLHLRRLVSQDFLTYRGTTLVCAFVVYAITVGLSPLLIVLSRVAVYEEAISWSTFFSLLTIFLVIEFYFCLRRALLVGAIVSSIFAANARASGALIAVGVGLFLYAFLIARHRRDSHDNAKTVSTALLASALVIMPSLVFMIISVSKFRTPLPSLLLNVSIRDSDYWRQIRAINGDTFTGIMFAPTQIWNIVRPDNPRLSFSGDYVQNATDYILASEGSMHLESSASLSVLAAAPLLAFMFAMLYFTSRRLSLSGGFRMTKIGVCGLRYQRKFGLLLVVLPVTLLLPGAITMSFVGVAVRYLADLYPFVVSCSLSFFLVFIDASRRGRLAVGILFLGLLTLVAYSGYLGLMTRIFGLHV